MKKRMRIEEMKPGTVFKTYGDLFIRGFRYPSEVQCWRLRDHSFHLIQTLDTNEYEVIGRIGADGRLENVDDKKTHP